MRVICINDSQKPKEIPEEKWIKFGDKYTVDKLMRLTNPKSPSRGMLGVTLKEKDLTGCDPYKYYGLHRFKPLDSDEELLDVLEREMLKEDILELQNHE